LKGYELNVADHLPKPFTIERFIQAVEKVSSQIEKIIYDDVLFIEGMSDYRNIQTESKKTLTPQRCNLLLSLSA